MKPRPHQIIYYSPINMTKELYGEQVKMKTYFSFAVSDDIRTEGKAK